MLLALVRTGCSLALKDLAAQAGMTPAKAHPYLVSFGQLGLVVQDAAGLYGLGPLAFGALSDALRPWAGIESVRWVLIAAALAGLGAAAIYWRASRLLAAAAPR